MKLVVLDGYTTNPGDLSWDALRQFGEIQVYDWTKADEIVERLKGVEAVFTNKVKLGEEHFSKLPDLKYIGVIATGFDNIDLKAARQYGIAVSNVPVYANYSVPQLTFALILELCYHLDKHSKSVTQELYWSNNTYNSYWLNPLIGLDGKTLGVIGMGRIGQQVANIGTAFGMKILAYDVYKRELPNVEWVEVEELLKRSDIVSIHCPLMDSTRGIINKETLALMKPEAFFINTSRGPLMVDQDVADALNEGKIAGAGLDVLGSEPPAKDNPLLKAKNVVITPHIGWATINARKTLIETAAENLKAFLLGEAKNVVN